MALKTGIPAGYSVGPVFSEAPPPAQREAPTDAERSLGRTVGHTGRYMGIKCL